MLTVQLFMDDDEADGLCSDDDLLESRELFPMLLIAVACLIRPPLKKYYISILNQGHTTIVS